MGIRFKYRSIRAYYGVFVVRRLIIVWIAVQVTRPVIYQLLILFNMNILCLIYEGINKPSERKFN